MVDAGGQDGPQLDDEEFQALLEQEIPRLRRVARRVAPAGVDADDLTNDALERAWRHRGSFRGDAAISTWLYRIVSNRAADMAVKRSTVPIDMSTFPEDELDGLQVEDPAALLDRAGEGERLRAALARLTPVNRMVLVLHDGEGMPVGQIAEACALSEAATHKRLQRARAQLVQAILDPSHEPASPESPFCFQCRMYAADYLNDSLDEANRRAIEAHLRVCTRCPPLAQAALGLRELMDRGAPNTTVHEQVTSALRADDEL